MFSLLAEKVVEPRSRGVAVQPRVPREVDGERSLTVPPPPPEHVGGTPPSGPSTGFFISATEVVEPESPVSPSVLEIERREQAMTRIVFAEVGVEVARERIGIRAPRNTVTATVWPSERPGDYCPGRPEKPRSPGTHPHGGPPACGNPHGEPPGQAGRAEKAGATGSSHGSPRGRTENDTKGSSSETHGKPHETPPGHSNDGGSHGDQPGGSGDGGSGHSAPSGNPGPSSGHPHGGPPGHTKKSSSESSGSSSSGNPHGGPPGQQKKRG